LFDLASDLNRDHSVVTASLLKSLAATLGFLNRVPSEFLQSSVGVALSADEIESMIQKRNEARMNKDYDLADELRDGLMDAGVILEDSSGTTTWRRS
jgi:cysteinyl-tRNA synthetase